MLRLIGILVITTPVSAAQTMLLHVDEAGPAILAIDEGEECRHDRTPLSFDGSSLTEVCFRPFSQLPIMAS